MNRNEFMAFFRSTEKLNTLSAEDRVEIFSSIMLGSSDFTVELLNSILDDYSVENIQVTETETSLIVNEKGEILFKGPFKKMKLAHEYLTLPAHTLAEKYGLKMTDIYKLNAKYWNDGAKASKNFRLINYKTN